MGYELEVARNAKEELLSKSFQAQIIQIIRICMDNSKKQSLK